MPERADLSTHRPRQEFGRTMVREANLLASRTDRLFLAVLGGPPGPGVLIDGSFDAGAAQLWIAEDTFRALSPEAAGTPDLVRLPGFLLSALVELALENPIEAFRDALASEFLQREAKLGSAPDRPGLGLRLEDCGAPLILYLGDGALERVFERLEAAPIFRGDALESVATLEVIFEAARTDLSLEELAALRPGDVVLLTLDEVPPGARAVLRDSDEALGRVRLEGETATLVRLGRRDMEDDTDDTEAGVDIDPVTVDLAVAARLELTNRATGETRTLRPVYVITNENEQQFIQNRVLDWGITVTFTGMEVNQGAIKLGVEGVSIQPEEWMVVQAYEKPFISILWLGTLILLAGFTLASVRRFGEQRSRKRDVKTEAA